MSASLKRKTMMHRGGGGRQSASASAVGLAQSQFNTSTGNGNGGGSKKKGSTRSPGGKGGGRGARGSTSRVVMDDAFGLDQRRPPSSSSNVCHARFFNGELIYYMFVISIITMLCAIELLIVYSVFRFH